MRWPRIAMIRARDCCGSPWGVGFMLSHYNHRRRRHDAIRIHLWWWHIIIERLYP